MGPFSVEVLRKIRRTRLRLLGDSGAPVVRLTLVGTDYYTVRRRSYDPTANVGTPLGPVGATILARSKVILLECLGYLLRFLDPRLAEVFYMDTDSIFVALCHSFRRKNVHLCLGRGRVLQNQTERSSLSKSETPHG